MDETEGDINSYKNKLRALLEGLETQQVEKLLKIGKTGDFRNYGKAYIESVRSKLKETNKLIDFMKYYKNNVPIGTQQSSLEIVTDYLKTTTKTK